MIRRLVLVVALLGSSGCTQVATDANAVVALRFDGSAYPSVVVGDSLRDSLGALQPLVATALNYRNEPVPDAPIQFLSRDTLLQIFEDGVVYARGRRPDTVMTVFATTGSLQSVPDSLFVVLRADSIAADSATMTRETLGDRFIVPEDAIVFRAFVSGEEGAPATAAQHWLVSFQLQLHDELLDPTDTTAAYTFTGDVQNLQRIRRTFIDTTSSAGVVSRGLIVKCDALMSDSDSVIVIATLRDRRPGTEPKRAQTVVRLQTGTCQ